jgi:adenylate cyclase
MVSLLDDDLRDALEGVIPCTVATCAADGTPNVTYVSQAHFVDPEHIALSYQFFNKTRANVLQNPRAAVALMSPTTGSRYTLDVEYRHTESDGPLFESMKARLAGIASHTGMAGVFRLLGADVYRVLNIECAIRGHGIRPPSRCNRLTAVRATADRIVRSPDLAALFGAVLDGLRTHLGVQHAMILMLDAPGRRLYTVASTGYPQSGVGSEIALGCGVIGVAAEQRTPIRISYLTADYTYSRAIRESAERAGLGRQLETAIPFPGLPDSRSQLAVPVLAGDQLLGAICVESPQDLRFNHEDEDAIVAIAAQAGLAILAMREEHPETPEAPAVAAPAAPNGPAACLHVRHFAADDSVFLGDDYLIKGVAGAILAKLLREHQQGRTDFTNRELRLDPSLKLPDLSDNLEARLVLLQRRLGERSSDLRIEKTGRGRFHLHVGCRITFTDVPAK